MDLPYRKHFPSDWDDGEIFQCVLSVVNDPRSSWKQITGKKKFFFRPVKFLVDGECAGRKIRVVIEPKSNEFLNGRGILTAYPLD
jgi:hypothetical protein